MTRVGRAAPKRATTGTRSDRATDPAWRAATAQPTWCSFRAVASNPHPVQADDTSGQEAVWGAGGGSERLWTQEATGTVTDTERLQWFSQS